MENSELLNNFQDYLRTEKIEFNDKFEKKVNIILISGKKRAGKDTFGNSLIKAVRYIFLENGDENLKNLKIEKISFAKVLKENSFEDTKVLTDRINNLITDFEKTIIGKMVKRFGFYKNIRKELYTTKEDFGDGDKNILARSILEFYGTNIFRNRVDSNYWVNETIKCIKETVNKGIYNIYLPDCRFENEIDLIKEAFPKYNVKTVRVNRPSLVDTNNHISNTALDNYKNFDYTITTDDIKTLKRESYIFVKTELI